MSLVTLVEAKEHMNVIGSAQDDYVQQCIDAAESHVEQYLNRSLTTWEDDETTSDNNVPPDVRQAIMMLAADYFNNREAAIVGSIHDNPAVDRILTLHRIGMGI